MCVQQKLQIDIDKTETITKSREHIFTQVCTHTYILFNIFLKVQK